MQHMPSTISLHPDYQTITLPYECNESREAAHRLIAGLVEHGLGFAATYEGGYIVIRMNGGF